ncbi:hypothetical protein [Streptomyces caelestis]|uniref:hypothetical protein n=1 Tax=Streptomyces caelestis TaxID=36816 RepID=UPI0036FCF726
MTQTRRPLRLRFSYTRAVRSELLRTELPRSRIAEGRSFTLPSTARFTHGCLPKLVSG